MAHKPNMAAKRKRAIYVAENRRERNKRRKAAKEQRKNEKLLRKGKGPLAKKSVTVTPEEPDGTESSSTE